MPAGCSRCLAGRTPAAVPAGRAARLPHPHTPHAPTLSPPALHRSTGMAYPKVAIAALVAWYEALTDKATYLKGAERQLVVEEGFRGAVITAKGHPVNGRWMTAEILLSRRQSDAYRDTTLSVCPLDVTRAGDVPNLFAMRRYVCVGRGGRVRLPEHCLRPRRRFAASSCERNGWVSHLPPLSSSRSPRRSRRLREVGYGIAGYTQSQQQQR